MVRMERMVVKEVLVGLPTRQDFEEASIETDLMINKLQVKVEKDIKDIQASVQPLHTDVQSIK